MDKRNKTYLFKTNYFQTSWTWFKRGFAAFILIVGTFWLPLDEEYFYLRIIIASVIAIYIALKQKDDLAIDENNLYHLQTSLFRPFSKVTKYNLQEVHLIRCTGIHNTKWELIDFFGGHKVGNGRTNSLEIHFIDNSSVSYDLAISRDQLDKIVQLAREYGDKKTKPNKP